MSYLDYNGLQYFKEKLGPELLSDDVKQALLQIASKVAYIDNDGQDYYDDLYDALYPSDGAKYTLTDSEMTLTGTSATAYNSETGGYYNTGNTRLMHTDFDLTLDKNKKYTFVADVEDGVQFCVLLYPDDTITKVGNHETITVADDGYRTGSYEFANSIFTSVTNTDTGPHKECLRIICKKNDNVMTLNDFENIRIFESDPPSGAFDNSAYAWAKGYINGSGGIDYSSTNGEMYSKFVIPVVEGHTYRFANSNANWNTGWYGYLFVKDDLTTKSARTSASSTVTYVDITVPTGYSYLAISSRNMENYYSTATLTDITQ